MAAKLINLSTPEEIVVAFIQKGGRKGMSIYAKQADISIATLSHHVHGRRKQEDVLQGMANYLGVGVYGVMPERRAASSRKTSGKSSPLNGVK